MLQGIYIFLNHYTQTNIDMNGINCNSNLSRLEFEVLKKTRNDKLFPGVLWESDINVFDLNTAMCPTMQMWNIDKKCALVHDFDFNKSTIQTSWEIPRLNHRRYCGDLFVIFKNKHLLGYLDGRQKWTMHSLF